MNDGLESTQVGFEVLRKPEQQAITYVDLFSGAGDMSLGFDMAGFENVFSIDCDRDSCSTYRENMPTHPLTSLRIICMTRYV